MRGSIAILELEGALFFGNADRTRTAGRTARSFRLLVRHLDFRRVTTIDATGAETLDQIRLQTRRREAPACCSPAWAEGDGRRSRSRIQPRSATRTSRLVRRRGPRDRSRLKLAILAREGIAPGDMAVPLDARSSRASESTSLQLIERHLEGASSRRRADSFSPDNDPETACLRRHVRLALRDRQVRPLDRSPFFARGWSACRPA